ncbi:type III secretion system gatekeeper subunit SctW [Acanthopleuribacter pedis]|uniref:Type III secretion system gatekeeper subunit SctW n=1 Tax=Acanthopleuribacter pedis TaxID=442870 RepID=A0A8J7QQE7_9BACT|nr:type III secretion system gatekeeper subunit SctW [Acanthopleuribacter pedis]MBO1322970.1 type III secretion system gatekeeper subunit SctW [Acanthopleuribacter pedis]
MSQIQGIQQAAIGIGAARLGQTAAGLIGKHQGEAVKPTNIQSMVADAAEEMSFVFGSKASKKLSQRKTRQSNDLRNRLKQKAEAYMRRIPDLGGADKLMQYLDHLKKGGRQHPRELLQQGKQQFKDVSHRYAALAFAYESLEGDGAAMELRQSLAQALADLEAEHGPAVRAGLNVSETAAQFAAGDGKKTQDLRDFYRHTVLAPETFVDAFESVINHYPDRNFLEAISFMIAAVGRDLHARGPSLQPNALKKILDDLFRLEMMGHIYRDAESLLDRVFKLFKTRSKKSPRAFMQQFMALKKEVWLQSGQLNELVEDLGFTALKARIFFVQEFQKMIKKIPLKAFDDLEMRERMLEVIVEVRDAAVEEEEKMEEAG